MTRFARAKGSKASNERMEEEATPWEDMVAHMKPAVTKKAPHGQHDVEDLMDYADDGSVETGDESENDDGKVDNNDDGDLCTSKTKAPLSSEGDEANNKSKKNRHQRNKDKCLVCKEVGHQKRECPELSEDRRKELQDLFRMKVERKGQGTGRKKTKKSGKPAEASEGDNVGGKKPARKKREVLDRAGQVVQENEALFQGFRVSKTDAARLKKLYAKLVREKVAPADMRATLKLERRRAEKHLSNTLKNVCYKCRKPGHFFGDCPNVGDGEDDSRVAAGQAQVCFKCGSADHTSKSCQSKLRGGDAYRFANCFVCGETGHLAKSCPDNPRGLYPKGGGCRFCGSVEHLKSDCPRKSEKDARTEIRADMRADVADLEDEMDLDRKRPHNNHRPPAKPAKKPRVVNF